MALFLVSASPKPQNWDPVQVTMPRVSVPASSLKRWNSGSARMAPSLASGTLTKRRFSSHVRRTVPSP